ncbi:transcriptional regulator with XRE-family HTH domain [Saccharothrix coeruleofusca]|uniref:helix-turn-helix domain-containing protein n=1 Tax=Saccharothrix coeruleofusca TaxID=33919 RepID=UPI001AE66DA7|nr:helix-turn-helix transcriptional regulator [Saccharothrix coeruleofusca]MBP2336159.1 transcriptional regulator with XRE-family HTH domain [Saccharothrix coeruleofusca]
MTDDSHIGRRLREVRSWRRLSLTAAAELAGITPAYLSMIERGLRPVTKRSTLEALADALQVAPTELSGSPFAPTDAADAEAHAAIREVETVLSTVDLGVDPGGEPAPWPQLRDRVIHLNAVLRPEADYAAQGRVVPGLLLDLHTAYVHHPAHRRAVLVGLLHAYHAAAVLTKNLGVRGLPLVAARLAQQCAEELDSPEWLAFAVWLRGNVAGAQSRAHQLAASVRGADRLIGSDGANALQARGMLHLNAALAAASMRDADTVRTHLDEAAALVERLPEQRENFAFLHFGRPNLGVWRVSLATELGQGAKVAELARLVDPDELPAKARRAVYWTDLGRALLTERATVDQGIRALVTAESIAPQRVRNDVFVREAVADLLRRARRDAAGRELRGLAWRMGVAPTG